MNRRTLLSLVLVAIILGFGLSLYYYRNTLTMEVMAIGIIILMAMMWQFTVRFEPFISTRPDVGAIIDAPFRHQLLQGARYINFDLTEKPRGNNAPFPTYVWWKYLYNPELNLQFQDCDQYRCQSLKQNGFTAEAGFNLQDGKYQDPTQNLQTVSNLNFGSDCGYYDNPIDFCNRYPHFELCPNNWISSNHPLRKPVAKKDITCKCSS